MSFAKVVAVVAAALLVGLVAGQQTVGGVPTISICSGPGALLSNVKYSITPDNIVPGSNLSITVSGTLSQAITNAQATVTAKFDGIPLYHKTINICEKAKTLCPIPAGPFSYSIDHKIPNIPVSGTVQAHAVLNALPSNAEIVCVDASASI